MKKLLLTLALAAFFCQGLQATTYHCSSVQQITDALATVSAGDEIIIASGTYTSSNSISSAYYYSNADGTAANPITIRGASSSNKPHLRGNSISSRTVLRIEGDYWIVRDLEISNGQKCLVFDNSNFSQAINCVTHSSGNEAIHVRDGSDHVTIDGCTVYNTGNVNPGFGEGIYIGTDKGSWSTYDPYVDYTTVKNCHIGPNVRAEAFDIKEGTRETIVEYNTIDGSGISGVHYADSFMDLKGIRTYVRYNTFNQNNEPNISRAIAVHDRGVELSGYEHIAHHNIFNMDGASGNMMEAYGGTSETYATDNTRSPSGDDYNSRITQSCPGWYAACNPGGGNQSPTIVITSPLNGSTYTMGENLEIVASASDGDGSVSLVEFFVDGSKIGEDSSSPYSYTWNNLALGSYTLTAIATDNDDSKTTSQSVDITVSEQGGSGPSDLSIKYDCGDTDPSNNKIKPYVRIYNEGQSAIPYGDLTIRYWFTNDGSANPVFNCDYAAIGKSHVNGSFVNTHSDHYYLAVTFDPAAGNLDAGDDSGNIKLRITKSDWSDFDENDDYSFAPEITSFTNFEKITLYHNGTLVWGTEPGGSARFLPSGQPATIRKSTEFVVYPNPASETISIRLDGHANQTSVTITNLMGQLVFSQNWSGELNHLKIDSSQFQKGQYLLRINRNGQSYTKKILIK